MPVVRLPAPLRAVPATSRAFHRFLAVAIGVGIVLLLVAAVATAVSVVRNQQLSDWVEHTFEVENTLNTMATLSERLEAARRGFLLVPDPRFIAVRDATDAALPRIVERIAVLTRDNPVQRARLPELRAAAAAHRASVALSIERARSDDPATRAISDFTLAGDVQTMADLRQLLSDMLADEARLLDRRRADQEAGLIQLYAVLGLTGVLMIALAGGTIAVILRYTRDLDRTGAALRMLNDNLEGAVAARTAELQRANGEIQRFAYIVSHDLRSPLVNVMGFTAELEATIAPLTAMLDRVETDAPALMDADANVAVRQDLPEAIGFIRSSTAKMDRLINAILQLSRQGRRTLQPVTVDLAELAATIRAATQHRLTEVGAELDIRLPMPPVVTDRLALEQIMSNLVENAVKYLQPGRPGRIAIAARTEAARVIVEISDNGRGVDSRDHERIFELFRRSGTQDQPGEGLGLAHVRALSYRLGGTVSCDSTLGNGAIFRLSLPTRLTMERSEQGAEA